MRILALPRNANPYQEALYGEIRRLGIPVAYLGELTRSRTLNVLLLPLEMAVRRAFGWRVVHLHWVFEFALPGAGRAPVMRRVAQAFFGLWLRLPRAFGMTLVWTAHNALPHDRIFHDDVAARRALVGASDLVIAHSTATLEALEEIGIRPDRAIVVPVGRSASDAAPAPRTADGTTRLLFFGRVAPYKGVEDLLTALDGVPDDTRVAVDVVGACDDPTLRRTLTERASRARHPVKLSLGHVPDGDLAGLLADTDAVVLPFRRVTTSSSAIHALDHGRPVIVPDLPALRELPSDATIRYDGTPQALATTIRDVAAMDDDDRQRRCAAARAYTPPSWAEIAEQTIDGMRRAMDAR
ncbi:glycosyltransferase family 4 protein [Miltoncostaea oceani]|uniref:glycosyltransferase family 4 protein n=1 Tax=Miltoncostaea oceani TaxID=2843216 RepID=UPI001C3E5C95|nr:glycosyltransferase family 4 protein [Miltoncostaea oceani]